MTGKLTEEKDQRWRLTPAGRRLASALAWGLRWKALARKMRINMICANNNWGYCQEAAHQRGMELAHLRKQVRLAVRKLEQDLEFGERSAYVEEALELLR